MADCVLVEVLPVRENEDDVLLGCASEDSSSNSDSIKSGYFVISESDQLCSKFQLNGVTLKGCSELNREMSSHTDGFTAVLKSISEDNADNCRKKRCADRYDSSESSDR